jgi:hypothetical protein
MRAMLIGIALVGVLTPAVSGALSMSYGRLMTQGLIAPAPRTEPEPPSYTFAAPPAGDALLSEMRGGFEAHSGLRVAFGIERMVLVNGQMVATTSLNLITDPGLLQGGGLRVISGGQGAVSNVPLNLGLIQIGPNNIATIDAANLTGTLIQNTQDNQQIQNITTIKASLNSATLLRANRLNENLRDAAVGAMRR